MPICRSGNWGVKYHYKIFRLQWKFLHLISPTSALIWNRHFCLFVVKNMSLRPVVCKLQTVLYRLCIIQNFYYTKIIYYSPRRTIGHYLPASVPCRTLWAFPNISTNRSRTRLALVGCLSGSIGGQYMKMLIFDLPKSTYAAWWPTRSIKRYLEIYFLFKIY